MSLASNLVKIIKEGQAQLQVPKTVFYNPVQEFNRDLSVLVLRTYLKYNVWHHRSEARHVQERGGMKILDALSASGLRSIRYAKELGPGESIVKEIVANDLSETAVDLIKKNIVANNVQDKVKSSLSDAAMLMYRSSASFDDRFHVIDLDPFGTGAQFFDVAVKSIGEAGLLMVTCTDTAVLCGNASESCFARYGSMSLRADFCHEAALRIILRSIESHAAVYGRYIKPLLSISADFYVRLFIQVFSQQAETKKSASKLSQLYLCKECKTHELNPLGTCQTSEDPKRAKSLNAAVKYKFKPAEVKIGDRCRICGGHYSMGGPLWSAPMHDRPFLELLKKELALPETPNEFGTFKRIQGMVHMCSEELEVPLFFCVDSISSILKMHMPRRNEILSAFANAGYQVSETHTNKCGVKTDAPSSVIWDIFAQHCDSINHKVEDSLAARILKRPREKVYDFTYNKAVESECKKLDLCRFQQNPTREWGPMTRPSAKDSTESSDANGGESERNQQVSDVDDGNGSDNGTTTSDTKRIKL